MRVANVSQDGLSIKVCDGGSSQMDERRVCRRQPRGFINVSDRGRVTGGGEPWVLGGCGLQPNAGHRRRPRLSGVRLRTGLDLEIRS